MNASVRQLPLFSIAHYYRTWGGTVYAIEEITYWNGQTEILSIQVIA